MVARRFINEVSFVAFRLVKQQRNYLRNSTQNVTMKQYDVRERDLLMCFLSGIRKCMSFPADFLDSCLLRLFISKIFKFSKNLIFVTNFGDLNLINKFNMTDQNCLKIHLKFPKTF